MSLSKEANFAKAIEIVDNALSDSLSVKRHQTAKRGGIAFMSLGSFFLLARLLELSSFFAGDGSLANGFIALLIGSALFMGGYAGEREAHLIRYARDLEERVATRTKPNPS